MIEHEEARFQKTLQPNHRQRTFRPSEDSSHCYNALWPALLHSYP